MPRLLLPLLCCLALAQACVSAKFQLLPDHKEPLVEYVLSGENEDEGKVLVVPVSGLLTDSPRSGLLAEKPGSVQQIAAVLDKAAADPGIRAVALLVDSPGGSVTASAILHHELARYHERTGASVTAVLLGLAASGGYYVSLAADRIIAHPTTLTGSVGTIFISPKVTGLMDKVGVSVTAYKSGELKDMGSPFRPATPEEKRLFEDIVADYNADFLALVRERRQLEDTAMATVADARVMTARQALAAGLVDDIQFLPEALAAIKKSAGLSDAARVVVYRRDQFADDTAYNPLMAGAAGSGPLFSLGLPGEAGMTPGFYHLWLPPAD